MAVRAETSCPHFFLLRLIPPDTPHYLSSNAPRDKMVRTPISLYG